MPAFRKGLAVSRQSLALLLQAHINSSVIPRNGLGLVRIITLIVFAFKL